MSDVTFSCPDLTSFCRLDELGLEVTGQRLEPDRAVLACRVAEADGWCRRCGCEGVARDTVIRRMAHEPLPVASHDFGGQRPPLPVRRLRACVAAGHRPRRRTAGEAVTAGLRWALTALVVQHLSVARVAEGLGVAWNTANDAVLAEGQRLLIDDEHRFDGASVLASMSMCGGTPAAATSTSP